MYTFAMGQYRQAVALSFVLLSIDYKENKIKYTICLLTAISFHTSAIIGIIYYFIKDKLFKTKTYIYIVLVAFVSNIFLETIFKSAIPLFPTYIASKLDLYSSVENYSLGLNIVVFIRIIILFYCIYKYKYLSKYKYSAFFINAYFISLVIYIGLGFIPQVAARGSIYFSITEIIISANLIHTIKGKTKIFFLVSYILFLAFKQWSFFNEWHIDYIPYKNYLIELL